MTAPPLVAPLAGNLNGTERPCLVPLRQRTVAEEIVKEATQSPPPRHACPGIKERPRDARVLLRCGGTIDERTRTRPYDPRGRPLEGRALRQHAAGHAVVFCADGRHFSRRVEYARGEKECQS
ncbi:hypothetical protein MRX96_015115 [Rhipicephalus microplus]